MTEQVNHSEHGESDVNMPQSNPDASKNAPASGESGQSPAKSKPRNEDAEKSAPKGCCGSTGDKPCKTCGNQADHHDSDHDCEDAPSVVVRYGAMDMTGEFKYGKLKAFPTVGTKVVIRTDRGVELGTVLAPVTRKNQPARPRTITDEKLKAFLKESGPDFPFRRTGRVLRIANQQDIVDFRHLEDSSAEAGKYCRGQIKELKLPMRLIKVEHLLGGERIVFYFTAENRVDFRELVRILASQYRTRIEMRQVGARDEAHLVADYERCGQRCCCKQYLKILKPVSMRMAKIQKATLDPSKISGRCGRLMCCLRYEDEAYDDLRKNLPRKNSWLRTEHFIGRVQDAQILTQLIKLWLPDNSIEVVHVDDIIERDIAQPTEEQLKEAAIKTAAAKREAASTLTYQQPAVVEPMISQQEIAELEAMEDSPGQQGTPNSKRRRGRRRRRRPGANKSTQNGNSQNSQSKSAENRSGKPQSKNNAKRRPPRKPRNGKPSAGGASGNQNGSKPAGAKTQGAGNSAKPANGQNFAQNKSRRRRRKPGGNRKPGNPGGGNQNNAPQA